MHAAAAWSTCRLIRGAASSRTVSGDINRLESALFAPTEACLRQLHMPFGLLECLLSRSLVPVTRVCQRRQQQLIVWLKAVEFAVPNSTGRDVELLGLQIVQQDPLQ